MDLIGGYLLVILVLFAGNIALLVGDFKISNVKVIACSLAFAVITFVLLNTSSYLNQSLSFLLSYFGYLFLVIAVVLFAVMFFLIKNNKLKTSLYPVLVLFLISAVLLSSQADLSFFEMILYSLLVFIILFVVFQLSKLLHHAKRQYSVIIGEYMSLFSILIFIFAMTYNSTINLNYRMFTAFLILTPTYQLIYVIIAVIVILVIGVLLNDRKGGNS